MNSEPVLVIVGGGTALVQIGLQLLAKYSGIEITPTMTAALTSLAALLLASWARNRVTPMNTLPAGVAGKIADAKAAKG